MVYYVSDLYIFISYYISILCFYFLELYNNVFFLRGIVQPCWHTCKVKVQLSKYPSSTLCGSVTSVACNGDFILVTSLDIIDCF